MNHDEVVRQKLTERYLLAELDPDARDQFEEHFFECPECALDIRAGAQFVDGTKSILADSAEASVPARIVGRNEVRGGWFSWLRPAFAVPVFALLLAVIVYQNRTNSRLQQAVNSPQIMASAVVNLNVRGTEPIPVSAQAGQAFGLTLNVPADSGYTSYKLDLYSSRGKLEWSRTIPASGNDGLSLFIPGGQELGALAVRGIKPGGESVDLGRFRIELQSQK